MSHAGESVSDSVDGVADDPADANQHLFGNLNQLVRLKAANRRSISDSGFDVVCDHWPYASQSWGVNSFQCPSETTSTVPSLTLMAVSSSIAYAGFGMPAAQLSASAMELPGMFS